MHLHCKTRPNLPFHNFHVALHNSNIKLSKERQKQPLESWLFQQPVIVIPSPWQQVIAVIFRWEVGEGFCKISCTCLRTKIFCQWPFILWLCHNLLLPVMTGITSSLYRFSRGKELVYCQKHHNAHSMCNNMLTYQKVLPLKIYISALFILFWQCSGSFPPLLILSLRIGHVQFTSVIQSDRI